MIPAPEAFKAYRQFILWSGDKVPIDPQTLRPADPHDPSTRLDYQTAASMADLLGPGYGLGFVFTDHDPFFFLDIDHCGPDWSPLARQLCQAFAGCAVEVSISGTGLHVFGSGSVPPHSCKNIKAGLEFYTSLRFAALTGTGLTGNAAHVPPAETVKWLVDTYFTPGALLEPADWTDGPCEGYGGPGDDLQLIDRMLASRSVSAMFGGRASVLALWTADVDALAAAYPAITDTNPYDHSSADAALCAHLAFWTGKDCERMDRLFRMSGLVRGKWLDREKYRRDTILKAVAGCRNVLGAREQPTAPREAADLNDGAPEKCYRLTELGNAERFANKHGAVVRFISAWKKWIYYDGRRWQVGADDRIRRLAQQTVKELYSLAAEATDSEWELKLAKWAATSCKSASITAMLREAAALLAIEPGNLDKNPFLFNCWNCTIDLSTGSTYPHRKEDFITKITPVPFDPKAKAPLFEKVVRVAFAENQNLLGFIQRFAGYSMTGSTKEQCMAIWYGAGANGKSTILNALSEALGEYSQTTRPETLMVKRTDGIPSDIAKLNGARLVIAAEAEDGHRLAESAVKQMTGGEKLQARALYADWSEFVPQFKIVLCTNHKPVIRGGDYAIWRRIRLVPFNVTIPENQRDLDLAVKLKAELPGILAWIVTGAADWSKNGLGQPEEIRSATAAYQTEQNVVGNFIDNCCILKDGTFSEAGQLFLAFDKWLNSEGHHKVTQTKFGRMLTDIGFKKGRENTTGRTVYQGICLNTGMPLLVANR